MKFSSFKLRYLCNVTKIIILAPIALINRKRDSNIWIIAERPDQARDNGYCFFKYLREKHPDQKVYYIINKDAKDFAKIETLGNIIQFNSWKHYYYYDLASVHISAHIGGCVPKDNPYAKRIKKILNTKDVFLPHGVSYGISEFCMAKYANLDLFVTSGKPEYENVLANYGYTENQVVYTGFPRLDGWYGGSVNSNQIVLMPTWRQYLYNISEDEFINTEYYRAYQYLINDSKLKEFLESNNLKVIFYLHNDMRQFANLFNTYCSAIEVVYKDDTYDIQELLKSSALLITDYSSVHFDFAYMEKPVIYYQFDQDEFWNKQYKKSSFSAENDGFGPVCYEISGLIESIKLAFKNCFKLEGVYLNRMKRFYELHDTHNCDRVYKEIMNHFCYNRRI